MNIVSHRKGFENVLPDEKLYILDPKDQSIREITVLKSYQHPKSQNKMVWVVEAYIPFRLDSIKDEALKEAKGFGTHVSQKFYVPRNESCCMLMSTVPTIVATERKYIEVWMAKEKSRLILPRRNV